MARIDDVKEVIRRLLNLLILCNTVIVVLNINAKLPILQIEKGGIEKNNR